MDPSFRNWGLVSGMLDLESGTLDLLEGEIIETKPDDSKQVRQNSKDIEAATLLLPKVLEYAKWASVIFVEVPVGSQSASGMKAYGICIGVLATLKALGYEVIEVTALECKQNYTGDKNATKLKMIQRTVELYPNFSLPAKGGKILNKAEHIADSISAIHAGVRTPLFKNILRIYKGNHANHDQSS